ncbi:MAG: right-handed parallel beta-helix repeat-containing protein [Spirochaetaceae bacterium]|jgi:hypothetical protein|nr:right-handed parallel beta-helix repeat-containing protein [Spirochaetaceae bacterium]
MEYHVSKKGADSNPGSVGQPFLTVSKAASVAQAGDSVIVHEGVYRERVSPVHSGTEALRILYAAAPGEKVSISGADAMNDWTSLGSGLWKTVIANSAFGTGDKAYNPYKELIFGDWLDVPKGKRFHTGEVFSEGKPLQEAQTLDELKVVLTGRATGSAAVVEPVETTFKWYCEVNDTTTTIWANFGKTDPTKGNVEITMRPFVFFPEQTMRNYITVRGFHLTKAATNWAPPTAFQGGLAGPHWAKGWVFEDLEVSYSKCSGISLGKEISTGENEWTRLRFKQGTEREREVIFRAAGGYGKQGDWNKATIGSHIVRNCVIHDCGQTGIVGHLGGVFSLIENNHIYDIHTDRSWMGAEIGGIKMHAAIDTIIRNNTIHNCYRGLWLDWQAQGTRVSRNVFWDNDAEDFFVEVSHGPYLADHNIFLSPINYRELSQGGALCHNLFTGRIVQKAELNRYTPYHFPHDTEVAGVMTISGGDVRYYNNIFTKSYETEHLGEKRTFWMDEIPPNLAPDASLEDKVNHERNLYVITAAGASCYDDYPGPDDKMPWENDREGGSGTPHTDAAKLRVYFGGNIYSGGALPCAKEKDALITNEKIVEWKTFGDGRVEITIQAFPDDGRDTARRVLADTDVPADTNAPDGAKHPISSPLAGEAGWGGVITTDTLGEAFHPEQPFTNPDGSPIVLDTDFFGKPHGEYPLAGPFASKGNFLLDKPGKL